MNNIPIQNFGSVKMDKTSISVAAFHARCDPKATDSLCDAVNRFYPTHWTIWRDRLQPARHSGLEEGPRLSFLFGLIHLIYLIYLIYLDLLVKQMRAKRAGQANANVDTKMINAFNLILDV